MFDYKETSEQTIFDSSKTNTKPAPTVQSVQFAQHQDTRIKSSLQNPIQKEQDVRYSMPDIVQKIRYDRGEFVEGNRPEILSWSLSRKSGLARCHSISANYIEQYIVQWLNNYSAGTMNIDSLKDFIASLNYHSGDNTAMDTCYDRESKQLISKIENSFKYKLYDQVAENATALLQVAISAPRNLRYGNPNTNSSIHEALDFPLQYISTPTLPPGTIVIYENKELELINSLKICYLSPEFPQLSALQSLILSVGVSVYTTKDTVQSSDHTNQNYASELSQGNLPFGIPWGNTTLIFNSDL